MPYNIIAGGFHTKKLCSTLRFSSSEVRLLHRKLPFCVLGATYDVRRIEKRAVDFVLVLIELFARCYSCGATSEYRPKIGVFAPKGSV